ncbi:hypothetical protein LCGC14_0893310, partial [marine sediment metagenome]
GEPPECCSAPHGLARRATWFGPNGVSERPQRRLERRLGPVMSSSLALRLPPVRAADASFKMLLDGVGNETLLYKDEDIACWHPYPLKPRERPPVPVSPLHVLH